MPMQCNINSRRFKLGNGNRSIIRSVFGVDGIMRFWWQRAPLARTPKTLKRAKHRAKVGFWDCGQNRSNICQKYMNDFQTCFTYLPHPLKPTFHQFLTYFSVFGVLGPLQGLLLLNAWNCRGMSWEGRLSSGRPSFLECLSFPLTEAKGLQRALHNSWAIAPCARVIPGDSVKAMQEV